MNNILIESGNNTEIISIANEKDISYCVEKYMGMEFSNYLKGYYSEIVERFKEESMIAREKVCDYESDLAEKNELLYDIEKSLAGILDYIKHSEYADIQKVSEKIKELKIDISSQL